ncbi:hypothetical protein [Providencia rettgeri]|uniref:phage tail fiber protein n=1 Tax=Providencia rettgeri TaxID=587 RepID=UPI001F13B1A6|nr:hypothetical protein [Providencia rettgeri]
MIYEIGTISTKANDPKITGKNTLWKNSVTKVSVGQIILIQSGNAIYQNSIRSVESDTQMTLSFPVPVALTDVKYVISITMIGSVSDGVNKATAMVTESYQLMMILNRLMTESGVIKVVLPDGTEMQLRTEKERDRLLDGKFDKAPALSVTNSDVLWKGQHAFTQVGIGDAGMAGKRAWISLSGISLNPKGDGFYNIIWPEKSGMLMQVGDFGIGGVENGTFLNSVKDFGKNKVGFFNATHATEGMAELGITDFYGSSIVTKYSNGNNNSILLLSNYGMNWLQIIRKGGNGTNPERCNVWTNKNTTKDSNGNLKPASPIVKVFADHIELNEESEGVELEKLGTGRYKLKGTLGMHSDASWGGIHGGLVVPNGINNLPLVWADFDVLPDGDIVIETRYRKHALHQMLEAQRLMTYPEFLDENNEEREDYDYCDIPNGHWIDVRVNMPSNSIYNQKQAEAERLAKLEAERLAQEEAKRAAEEAERAEQEDQNEA